MGDEPVVATTLPKGKKTSNKDALATMDSWLNALEKTIIERLTRLEEALVGLGKPKSRVGDFYTQFVALIVWVEEFEEKVEFFEE
ncbi:hypothetical protein U1Q18_012654 [Sarracenia purpurea var. burkii]